MDKLLTKAKINDSGLKSYITKTVAKNLGSLSEPCYYPSVKKDYFELLKLTGLKEQDIKEFSKRRWAGRKEAKFATQTNAIANFYVFLLEYFLRKRDKTTYKYIMIFYMIRHYANLMYKTFKYCNNDTFKYALEILTKTHLFVREKTISNAIFYLSNEMVRRWSRGLREGNLDSISRFMQDSRTRVSQSMKSFAQTYYKAAEEGSALRSNEEPSEEDEKFFQNKTEKRGDRLADEMAKKITVYRFSDRKAQEAARSIAKINSSLATLIVSKLNNIKYSDNLRIIFRLFIKELKDSKSLCGNKYEPFVRNLMSIKRTKLKIYFKQQINILLMNILEDIDYKSKYGKQTSQTQFFINLYLAYYLTMLLKNSVC